VHAVFTSLLPPPRLLLLLLLLLLVVANVIRDARRDSAALTTHR